MRTAARPARWLTLLAFSIIYFVWGSTFLAIRVGVRELPPFLFAGMRFFTAGVLLFVWLLLKRALLPNRREWTSAILLSILIFVIDYGLLFWAEQRVPSGIAAVMMATIPVFMSLLEIILLQTQQLTVRLSVALAVGIFGVAILMSRSMAFGETPVDARGSAALLIASVSWSVASILTRKLPLPSSKPMSAAVQMLCGGTLLILVAALFGEFRDFHASAVSSRAWFALAYLTVAGSIVAFTAYIWLLHHESPTKVATYAYVNPVVAVVVGYFLGGEVVGSRMLLGTLLILASVVVITTTTAKKKQTSAPVPEIEEVAS